MFTYLIQNLNEFRDQISKSKQQLKRRMGVAEATAAIADSNSLATMGKIFNSV